MDKDIKEQVTPLELHIAQDASKRYGVTVEEVLISARLNVTPEQLLAQKTNGAGKE